MTLLHAFVFAALAAGQGNAGTAPPPDDPIVCKTSKVHNVGTRMKPKPVCRPKSEWAADERDTQREIQQILDRRLDPAKASGR